jgi:small-conductance mechanosensitive channel
VTPELTNTIHLTTSLTPTHPAAAAAATVHAVSAPLAVPGSSTPPIPGLEGPLELSMPQLTWANFGDWLLGTPLRVIIVVVATFVVRWLLHRLINRVVATAASKRAERLAGMIANGRRTPDAVKTAAARHSQRTRTMGALLKSITTFVVLGIGGLTVLQLVGIPLGPMLASASIGGVALAFGAQSLVKDFLSGVFMIIEDQYGVGDVIDTGEVVGTVENVSLRVTQLRDAQGMTWYVRNGEILRIGNKTQGWSTAIVDIPIAADQDVEKAMVVIRETVAGLETSEQWKDTLLEEPNVAGVESITAGVVTLRVLAKTVANSQWGLQRDLRERIKVALDREGIRSPSTVLPPYGNGTP